MDVAVEVAHEYEGITLVEVLQDGPCLGHLVEDSLVAVVGNLTDLAVIVGCGQDIVVNHVVELQAHFLEQEVVEVVVGEDDALLGQGALAMNVGLAVLLLVDL